MVCTFEVTRAKRSLSLSLSFFREGYEQGSELPARAPSRTGIAITGASPSISCFPLEARERSLISLDKGKSENHRNEANPRIKSPQKSSAIKAICTCFLLACWDDKGSIRTALGTQKYMQELGQKMAPGQVIM